MSDIKGGIETAWERARRRARSFLECMKSHLPADQFEGFVSDLARVLMDTEICARKDATAAAVRARRMRQ